MAVRETFAVGLVAGESVDLGGLGGLVGGGAPPGFSVLAREVVAGSEVGEDDARAQELKAAWEEEKTREGGDPECPMPHALFGCLLAKTLAAPAEAPAELPDDDKPSSALLRIAGGPRSVRITLDVCQSVEEAQGYLPGGALDAIFIVRKPPAEEGAEAADEEAQARGAKAEQLFADLQALSQQQNPGGHNPLADTFFGSIVDAATPEDLVQGLAMALISTVFHRTEYAKWLEGTRVVQMPPQELDLRHYDETLAAVPHACLSVPVILNALLEQVAINEVDTGAEVRALRQTWANNHRLMQSLEEACASLAGSTGDSAPSSQETGVGAALAKTDERRMRLSDPRALGRSAGLVAALSGVHQLEQVPQHQHAHARAQHKLHDTCRSCSDSCAGAKGTGALAAQPRRRAGKASQIVM